MLLKDWVCLATVAVLGPANLHGQVDSLGHWFDHHHNRDRPNYLREILPPEPAALRLPPPPPGETPAVVRGIYLNAWVFGSPQFYDLVALADTTEINAFVIDVKDDRGYVTYPSSVPTAISVGANSQVRVRNVRNRLAIMREHGIYPIARIVVAKDPMLAEGKPDWAIRDSRGGLWRDALSLKWVDPNQDSVWIYAADIAAEAVTLGFRELQFDYIRFPDESAEQMQYAIFPAHETGVSMRQVIYRQLSYLRSRAEHLGVPFTVDVFGLTTSATGDMGIGQNWTDLVRLADVVLPMIYPSHYPRNAYGIAFPNAEPYRTVRAALTAGLRRIEQLQASARIRPYLQSFSIRGVVYRAAELREQIRAVEDVGLTDWVFWNASARYPAAAFRPTASPIRTELQRADEARTTSSEIN